MNKVINKITLNGYKKGTTGKYMQNRFFLQTLIILLTGSITLHAQKSYWSVEAGFLKAHSPFFELYKGLLDTGAGYEHNLVKGLYAGGSFNIAFMKLEGSQAKTVVYKPALSFEYKIPVSKNFKLIPQLSAGYSFLSVKNKQYSYSDTQKGFLYGAKLKFVLIAGKKTAFYFYGKYDFCRMTQDPEFTRIEEYRNAGFTSAGIGIIINKNRDEKRF